jgi:hypothetical protein
VANPLADLRRVTKRIAELQAQQRALIEQIDLEDTDQVVVLAALELANESNLFLERVRGAPTVKQQRTAINLSRKLERVSGRLERLADSEAKTAGQQATAEASERLLSRLFNV